MAGVYTDHAGLEKKDLMGGEDRRSDQREVEGAAPG